MKLKLQQGGTIVPPFAVYQPFMVPTAEAPSTKSSKKDDEEDDKDVKMKDIYNLIKDLQGLPGDVTHASKALTSLLTNIEYKLNSPSSSIFGGTKSIASDYMKIIKLVSDIKFQSNQYENARNKAIENDSINEVVINSMGRVMVTDGEGFDWVTPEDLYKHSDKYQPITNAQLLTFRAQGVGGLAFNQDVINSVAGSISYNNVTEMIQKAISDLGKDIDSQDYIVKTKSGKLIKGLEDFIKAKENSGNYDASVEDLYRANFLTESQANQAQQALDYIYRVLPKSAIALLKVKSNGTVEGAKALIDTLVYSKTNITNKFNDLTPLKDPNKDSENDVKNNFVLNVQAGRGGYQGTFTLNNESFVKMSANMDVYESIKGLDGNAVGKTSIQKALDDSGLIHIVKGDKGVFLGDQKINIDKLNDIMYDGTGFARAELPVDSNGKPRFDLLKLIESYNIELLMDPKKAKSIMNNAKYKDLIPYLMPDGKFNKKLFAPFFLINGVTTRDLVQINSENKFVINSGADPNTYNTLIKSLSEANPLEIDKYKDLDTKNWYEFWDGIYDPIYKGTLFIPINMNKEAAAMGGNQNTKNNNYEQEYQLSLADYSDDNTNLNLLK